MAKPEWGVKRGCLNCGTKFYDFGRDPIVCPSCEASFRADDFARPRRGARPEAKNDTAAVRAPQARKRPAAVEEDEEELAEIAPDLEVDLDDEADDSDIAADVDTGDDELDEDDEEKMSRDADVDLENVEVDEGEDDEEDDDVLEADDDEDLESEISSEIDTDFRKEDVG